MNDAVPTYSERVLQYNDGCAHLIARALLASTWIF